MSLAIELCHPVIELV
jgi:hypothetical protein